MTTCKTGAEHIKSLKDGRTVFIDGKLVADVTEHPAFRNSVKSAAMLYDFQARPENIELMTFVPQGWNRRVNRSWQMPRNYTEMVQRRKAMQAWATLSYGFMGRSPDHLASTLVGQRMGIEVFEKHGPARARAGGHRRAALDAQRHVLPRGWLAGAAPTHDGLNGMRRPAIVRVSRWAQVFLTQSVERPDV